MTPLGPPTGEDAALAASTEKRRLPRKLVWGLVIVALYTLAAVFAPVLSPHDPIAQDLPNRLLGSSGDHLLGTDEFGRDVLSRLIHAARIDLRVAFTAALVPGIIGVIAGTLAGYFGGWVDSLIMRTADLVQAFPVYILIIALVFALGPGASSFVLAFAVIAWVPYARLTRGEILRVRDLDYVAAARTAGFSNLRVMFGHVLPNSMNQTIVYFFSDMVLALLALTAFSYLGLGIPPPDAEWGAMIAAGQQYIRDQWWLSTVPGFAIVGLGIGMSLMGDGFDDFLKDR